MSPNKEYITAHITTPDLLTAFNEEKKRAFMENEYALMKMARTEQLTKIMIPILCEARDQITSIGGNKVALAGFAVDTLSKTICVHPVFEYEEGHGDNFKKLALAVGNNPLTLYGFLELPNGIDSSIFNSPWGDYEKTYNTEIFYNLDVEIPSKHYVLGFYLEGLDNLQQDSLEQSENIKTHLLTSFDSSCSAEKSLSIITNIILGLSYAGLTGEK